MKTLFLNYKNEEIEGAQQEHNQESVENSIQVDAKVFGQMVQTMQKMADFIEKGGVQSAYINPELIADSISEGIERTRRGSAVQKTFTKDSIPLDDILERPAMFFTNKVSSAIFDDVKKGKVMLCPYGMVKFNPLVRYEAPGQKGKIITQSMAVVWSKAQAEFLRTHTDFGIKFFEKVEDAVSRSSDFMEKVVECYNYVKTLTDYHVQQKLIELNVPIKTDNFLELRKLLAFKMAENYVDMSALVSKQTADDMNEAMQLQMTRGKDAQNTVVEQVY